MVPPNLTFLQSCDRLHTIKVKPLPPTHSHLETLKHGNSYAYMIMKLLLFYVDGQKIATKLSKQITKETKNLKSLRQDYNASLSQDDSSGIIAIEKVLDPVKLEEWLRALGVWCLGTVPEKREVMDSYLMLCQSKKEQAMLKDGLQTLSSFYDVKKDHLLKVCTEMKSLTNNIYNRGVLSLLYRLLQEVTNLLQGARDAFHSLN